MKKKTTGQRALLLAGSIGPLGHLPASGTVTVAVVGVPLFAVMHSLHPAVYLAIVGIFTALSIVVHQTGDRILGDKDSRILVWDELVGYMVAVVGVPFHWKLALAAFVIERILDILKIPPAKWIEDHVPGGWGVVGDDIVAGLYTCALLHLIVRMAPATVGLTP